MKKNSYFHLICLIFFQFCLLNLSINIVNSIRDKVVTKISCWERMQACSLFADVSKTKIQNIDHAQITQLKLENQRLNSQIEGVYEWLLFEERIQEQIDRLKYLSSEKYDEIYWNDFFRRRAEELKQILEVELQTLPAKVIYRDPSSWSSSLWINIGENENEALGRTIIAENSPVVIGNSLVGVVEYVGKKHSRVRLITDAGLVPSVRVVRGALQNHQIIDQINHLEELLYARENIFISLEEKEILFSLLSKLKEQMKQEKKDWYLAKGELHGSSYPLWRACSQVLKGIGFNYNYSDEEGPGRDFKTGEIFSKQDNGIDFPTPIIQKGDLLITTGFDGVFPAGLHVANVTKVKKLKVGSYAYDIEAIPTASNLNELSVVFVIPPLEFEKK